MTTIPAPQLADFDGWFCKRCGKSLAPSHQGPCSCGETGRDYRYHVVSMIPDIAVVSPESAVLGKDASSITQCGEPFKPRHVGACIYCAATDALSDEHIIPFGLGGCWILHNASCPRCRDITSAFEGEVQRHFLILMRTTLRLPTRHPERRPDSFEVRTQTNGKQEIMNVPASEAPTMFEMPIFGRPGYLDGNLAINSLTATGFTGHVRLSELDEFRKIHRVDSLSFTAPFTVNFGKLLAKIGYGIAVHQYGLDSIEDAYVLPSILGKKSDLGCWVGCEKPSKPLLPKEQWGHRIIVTANDGVLEARVRLFANFGTPEYLVIVGRLR